MKRPNEIKTKININGDIVYISRLKVKLFKEKFSKYLMNDNRLEYSIYSC